MREGLNSPCRGLSDDFSNARDFREHANRRMPGHGESELPLRYDPEFGAQLTTRYERFIDTAVVWMLAPARRAGSRA